MNAAQFGFLSANVFAFLSSFKTDWRQTSSHFVNNNQKECELFIIYHEYQIFPRHLQLLSY